MAPPTLLSCRSLPPSSKSSCFTHPALLLMDSSHRQSLGTPEVSHQPRCLRTLRLAPSHGSPELWGKRTALAFCSHCWSLPNNAQGQGPECHPLLPALACSWEPAHSQAWAMVTHPESGVFETFLTWILRTETLPTLGEISSSLPHI